MLTDEIASLHLGKKSELSEIYSPKLLVAVPRCENREIYDIKGDRLPFYGYDIWHAYEFSALTENNLPVSSVLKLKYSCDNNYIIESKSLKLYLNSFNMSKFGNTPKETFDICKKIIEHDLSKKLKTDVQAEFINDDKKKSVIFDNYTDIYELVDLNDIHINEFKENPDFLQFETLKSNTYRLRFKSLRSNCRVTHQPDFGEAFIYYKSKRHIKEDSLIKYLVSFRREYHFHEECSEMIFKRLFDLLEKDDELAVCTLYTRRGGIDINPVRLSKNCNISDFDRLINVNEFTRCGIKQ